MRNQQTSSVLSLAQAGLGLALVPEKVVPAGFAGRAFGLRGHVTRKLTCYTRGDPDLLLLVLIEASVTIQDGPDMD